MARLTWILLPVTFWCWWKAYQLYLDASLVLHTIPPYANIDTQPSPFEEHTLASQKTPPSRRQVDEAEPQMNHEPDRLFYFIQLSDIHVSLFYKHGGVEHLKWFLNTSLPVVRPSFVVVTGDLTDAKDGWKISSSQHREEWIMYRSALVESGVLEREGFWWDQRGNHDCFNVPGWQSHHNYFKELSSTKAEQYAFQYQTSFGNYTFIALDACPIYGPSRPFNFFGYFDSTDMEFLERRLLRYRGTSNHTFVLSHYPISTTLTGMTRSGRTFEDLGREFSVFMCGHLHKLAGGLGEIMHAHHKHFLELELADLKTHGSYRIVAVDHDLISFVDASILPPGVHYKEKKKLDGRMSRPNPVVLITNPKDARYITPIHEPLDRIRKSTHIRFLVFSQLQIKTVRVNIDGVALRDKAKYTGNDNIPLWTVRWKPEEYDGRETHTLQVEVTDEDGKVGSHQTQFRLDETRPPLDIGPGESILLARISFWSPILFTTVYLVLMVVLLVLPKLASAYLHRFRKYHRWRVTYSRFLVELDKPQPIQLPASNSRARWWMLWQLWFKTVYRDFEYFIHASVFRLITLASLPNTFYPLYVYGLYIVVGPFFVGELIPSARLLDNQSMTESFGWFYLYGIFIEGKWLPMLDTWIFGLFELLYLFGPLVVYLSFCITPPDQLYARPPTEHVNSKDIYYFPPIHDRRKYPLHRRIYVRILVAVVVLYQLMNVFFIWLYYGPFAMLLSPGKTWFCMWAIYALYKHRWSSRGHEIDLDDRKDTWSVKDLIQHAKRRIDDHTRKWSGASNKSQ